MPDILAEQVLGTAAAARFLAKLDPDGHYSPLLLWRWMRNGVIAVDGTRIYLECARLGRRYVTSKEAISRLAERLAQRPQAIPVPPASCGPVGANPVEALTQDGFFA